MLNRCSYIYSDDARCVWQGDIAPGEMCREHRTIMRRKRYQADRNKVVASQRKSARQAVRELRRQQEMEAAGWTGRAVSEP